MIGRRMRGLTGPSRPPDSLPLRSYLSPLRRHLVLMAGCTLLGLVSGLAITFTHVPVYESRVRVLAPPIPVRVVPPGTEAAPRSVTPDTEAQLVTSEAVLKRLSGVLNVSEEGLADAIAVTAPPNTQLLRISFRATSPEDARLGAEAVAETYLVTRQQLLNEQRRLLIEATRARAQLLRQELESLRSYAQQLPAGSTERDVSRQRRVALFTEIRNLQFQLTELQNNAVQSGEVVSAANNPRRPIDQNGQVPVVSGAVLGLLLGIVVVRAADGQLLRVRGSRSVELAIKGTVPTVDASSAESMKQLAPLAREGGPVILVAGLGLRLRDETVESLATVLARIRPQLRVLSLDTDDIGTNDLVRTASLTGDTVLVSAARLDDVLMHPAIAHVDTAVLVVAARRTTVSRLRRAARTLERLHLRIGGVVLDSARKRADAPQPRPTEEVLV